MLDNELAATVATNLVEDSFTGAVKKIHNFFKSLSAQEEIEYGTAYLVYLHNTEEKYRKIKTLIYRQEPKDLYSFYECVGIKYSNNVVDTSKIEKVCEISNKLIITGTGGIGKSTLLKHLFLNTIDTTDFIPVMVELRGVNSLNAHDVDLDEIIYKNLCDNGFRLAKEYFKYSMEKGAYVILLDGYDEVKLEYTTCLANSIRTLSTKYPNNYYILSSRPMDDFLGWNDFVEAEAMPLTKEQAIDLIQKLEFDEVKKQLFIKELSDNLYEKYKSFASNPLLLTIMLLTFDNRACIPDKLNEFYDQAYSTLFNIHDGTKGGYRRDIRSGLSCEDFKLVFSYFCFKSFFSSEYMFTEASLRDYIESAKDKFIQLNFRTDNYIDDLVKSVCMMVKDGLYYTFSHRSFQEYFAAWYTCKLTDKVQSNLVTCWLKDNFLNHTEPYCTMLYNLQGDKFNKIILCTGIAYIKGVYDKYGFSVDFLDNLVERMNVINTEDHNYRLTLHLKNNYYTSIIKLTCKLNSFKQQVINRKEENEVAKQLYVDGIKPITISDALCIVKDNELLKALGWFNKQIEFIIDVYNNSREGCENRKKSVKSILDCL